MDNPPKSMGANVWLAVPGVIACVGIVWLGMRLTSMEARLSAPAVTVQPTSAESSSAGPDTANPAPTTQQPAAPTPAELDASGIVKFWTDTASRRVMAQCRAGDAGSAVQSLEMTLLVDATGTVLDARVEAAERAKATALYDCVAASLRSIQLPVPGKLVQGKVRLPLPAGK